MTNTSYPQKVRTAHAAFSTADLSRVGSIVTLTASSWSSAGSGR